MSADSTADKSHRDCRRTGESRKNNNNNNNNNNLWLTALKGATPVN